MTFQGVGHDLAENLEQRLLVLARLAHDQQALSAAVIRDVERIAAGIDDLVGPDEPPARLHGDLWAGNRLIGAGGVSWLIDGSRGGNIVGLTKFTSALNVSDIGAAVGSGDDGQIAQAIQAIPDGITLGVGEFGSGNSTNWAAIVRALLGDASTNVLATPSIMTLDNEEAEEGVGCIGTLIHDSSGSIVAGLSISAPIERRRDDWIALVREAGRQVSERLG